MEEDLTALAEFEALANKNRLRSGSPILGGRPDILKKTYLRTSVRCSFIINKFITLL